MTIEDVYHTLCTQGLIDVLAVPTPKPLPGQSIKLMKNRKTMVARRHLIRSHTNDDDASKGPFVPPTKYEIHWDPGYVKSYLDRWEAKGYMKIKPEKLKWSPFLLARVKKSDADAGLALDAEVIGSTPEKDNPGPASASSVPETPAPITPIDVESSHDETIATRASHSPEKRKRSSEQLALRRLRSQNRPTNGGVCSRTPLTPSRYLRGPGVSGSPPNIIPTASRASSTGVSPSKRPRVSKRGGHQSPIKTVDSSVKEDQIPASVCGGVDEDADAALAARLAEEESRPKRLLRSRPGTGSLSTFELPLLPSRPATTRPPPRKRRRVESPVVDEPPPPEPLRESGVINGATRGDEEVPSEPDDAATPLTVVTSRHSAPSDDTIVAAAATAPGVTEPMKEDANSPIVMVPQTMDVDLPVAAMGVMDADVDADADADADADVDVDVDVDADADGETDADAEGEDDDDLDAEGEPDDGL